MAEEPRPAPDDDRGRPVRHAPPLLVRLVRTDAVSAVLPPRKEREGRSRDQGSSSHAAGSSPAEIPHARRLRHNKAGTFLRATHLLFCSPLCPVWREI